MGAGHDLAPPGYDSGHEDDGSKRRLVIPGKRVGGLVALLLLPVGALLGLDSVQGQGSAGTGDLQLTAEFPRVLRFMKPAAINLGVTNAGDATLQEVTVTIDSSYLDAFTGVTLVPSAETISDGRLLIGLGDIAPGESQRVRVELRANHYWNQPVTFSVASGPEQVSLPAATLVLP